MSSLTVHPLPEKFPALATEINRLHGEITASARTSLEKAVRIGQLLREVKSGLKHGQWLSWLESNVRFDRRTATNYMKLYDRRSEWETISHLTLTEVYELLTVREKDPELAIDPEPSENPPVASQLVSGADAQEALLVPDPPVEITGDSPIIPFPGQQYAAQPSVEPTTEQDPDEANEESLFLKHAQKALKHLIGAAHELAEAANHAHAGRLPTQIRSSLDIAYRWLHHGLEKPWDPKFKTINVVIKNTGPAVTTRVNAIPRNAKLVKLPNGNFGAAEEADGQ